jgi:hypothetical protein
MFLGHTCRHRGNSFSLSEWCSPSQGAPLALAPGFSNQIDFRAMRVPGASLSGPEAGGALALRRPSFTPAGPGYSQPQ